MKRLLRKIKNFLIIVFGINKLYIKESLKMINNVSFDEVFGKVNELSGVWNVTFNNKKYFVKYTIEKDKTEYTFLDFGEDFKKCLENVVFRVFDFEFNKKDTFSNFR